MIYNISYLKIKRLLTNEKMEIVRINRDNIGLLEHFLFNDIPSTFRYYNSRSPSKAIEFHALTVVGIVDDRPVAYAHIDKERGNHWVGVCVIPEYQGNGYGKEIFKYVMDYAAENNIRELHLTVDRDNPVAYNMYVKFGFEIEKIFTDKVAMVYIHGNQITLPLSLSEGFYKLAQLEVLISSTSKANDDKLVKQYNDVYIRLQPFMDSNVEYHYNVLKEIYLQIFKLRNKETKTVEEYKYIEHLEDRVPRINRKIDALLQSKISNIKLSDKGNKRVFLFGHCGLGDVITNIGLIRYIATLYDEITYVVYHKNLENIKVIFKDEPSIKFYPVTDDKDMYSQIIDKEKFNAVLGEGKCDILLLGFHNIKKDRKDIKVDLLPFCFHDDAGLPHDIFWTYFHIPETEATFDLCRILKNNIMDYVFIHNHSSKGKIFDSSLAERISGKNKDTTLYINVNENEYPKGHRFYKLAEVFVNRPILDYKNIIINASYIFVSNSSFFCMSINLPIKTDNCYYVSTDDFSYLYDDIHGFEKVKDSRKIFRQIKDY